MKLSDTEKVFQEALGIGSPEKRSAFVRRVCGEDHALREKVNRLLKAHEESPDFLATEPGDRSEPAVEFQQPGTIIGRYKLIEKIGEGGFGAVYMAEQQEPVKRRVAFKIIKLGMDTKQVVARFEAERQALALMDHPHIAKVLDAGATDTGRPFFVMELVRGVPITQFCEERQLTIKERLELFVPVCQAIQHAHQKGVIHRDIKPSNVLVTLNDTADAGHPMVIDFGVAKAIDQRLTEKTLYTRFAQMIGTPAYMSPEQAEMSKQDVDTRTDVYSLGVLLYELLTGETPFPEERLRAAGYAEIQRIISQEEPVRPSTALSRLHARSRAVAANRHCEPVGLMKLIKGDLDWIVLRAIDKDRTRRYETAHGLAMDIQRHLSNEPVAARPPSWLYRFQKSVRRNKLVFAAAATLAAVLLLGTLVSTWQARRATQASRAARAAEQHAKQETLAARRSLYASDMLLAKESIDASNFRRARELLDRHLPAADGGAAGELRGWEWSWLRNQLRSGTGKLLATLPGPVFGLDVSSDGRYLAASTLDGVLKVLDASSGREIVTITKGNGMPKKGVFFTGQNRILYNHAERETYLTNGFLKIWNIDGGTNDYVFGYHGGVGAKAISPDGTKVLFNAPYHGMRMFDLNSEKVLWETPLLSQGTIHSAGSILFSLPSGKEYLIGEDNGEIRIYSSVTGNPTRRLQAHSEPITALNVAPDGSRLVSAASGPETTIKVWDYSTLRLMGTLEGHQSYVTDVEFTSDGKRLVSSSADQTVRLWDLETFTELAVYRELAQEVWAVELTPDNRFVIAGGKRGSIYAWEPDVLQKPRSPILATGIHHCALSTIGNRVALQAKDGSLKLGDVGEDIRLRDAAFTGTNNTSIDLSADGRTLICGKADGSVGIYDIASERELHALSLFDSAVLRVEALESNRVLAGDFDHNLVLARVDADGETTLWRTFIDELAHRPSFVFAVSPNERFLATRTYFGRVILIDLTNGREVRSVRNPSIQPDVFGLDFSPDGKTLATADASGVVRLWDPATLTCRTALEGHRNTSDAVLFLPESNRLVSGGNGDEAVILWDLISNQELLRIPAEGRIVQLQFTARWNLLMGLTRRGDLYAWRAPP